jgi:hypothetical protein
MSTSFASDPKQAPNLSSERPEDPRPSSPSSLSLEAAALHCARAAELVRREMLEPIVARLAALKRPLPPARHTEDFRSVHWFGTTYCFTEIQAQVVALLWEAWENGTPDVGQRTLRAQAQVQSDRLQDVFKDKGHSHPAWGTMIHCNVGSKGTCRLQPPSS